MTGGLNELALFAGAGGGILGGMLHGWRTVAAVEIEDYPRRVLLQRQADGILPKFPIWDDVRTFDGKPWRGKVDVVSGGFPCQDISAAGKGAGIEGERSGLWSEMARIIGEVRPRYVFVENSPLLISRGLAVVLGDLAKMGYDAEWCIVSAQDCGAPHRRDRCWVVAYSNQTQQQGEGMPGGVQAEHSDTGGSSQCGDMADSIGIRGDKDSSPGELRTGGSEQSSSDSRPPGKGKIWKGPGGIFWWERDPAEKRDSTEPELGRVADGVAHWVDRLAATGNGQVAAVAAAAWEIMTNDR